MHRTLRVSWIALGACAWVSLITPAGCGQSPANETGPSGCVDDVCSPGDGGSSGSSGGSSGSDASGDSRSDAPPAAPCSFDGKTVASGSSVTAYQAATVSPGNLCVSQSRVCSDGTLSGTYAFASCSVTTVPAFYVSPSGHDTNAGTLAQPFLTLGKARSAMQASASIKTT